MLREEFRVSRRDSGNIHPSKYLDYFCFFCGVGPCKFLSFIASSLTCQLSSYMYEVQKYLFCFLSTFFIRKDKVLSKHFRKLSRKNYINFFFCCLTERIRDRTEDRALIQILITGSSQSAADIVTVYSSVYIISTTKEKEIDVSRVLVPICHSVAREEEESIK